jgi:signal recognition particle GTPase
MVFILTKMDAMRVVDAALSIKQVTGQPVKFVGTGENTMRWSSFTPIDWSHASWEWATFSP